MRPNPLMPTLTAIVPPKENVIAQEELQVPKTTFDGNRGQQPA
jgi:hypothetical protein